MAEWELALAASGSFVAAFLGAMVGLVLGSLRLPAILIASGSPAAAAGTNIAVSAAAALAGSAGHVRAGRVDWRIFAWMTPPSVAGAFLGGFFGHLIPSRLLLGGIAVVLIWNGLDFLLELRSAPEVRSRRVAAVSAGALIGVLGGAVGLILGTLRLPALIRSVGIAPHLATGTNLAVGFFLGIAGFLGHVAQLEVEWLLLAVSLGSAMPGAWLGARFTGRLSEVALRRAIGLALIAVAAAMAVTAAS